MRRLNFFAVIGAFFVASLMAALVAAEDVSTLGQREFFESRIRPVLAAHCYECHNSLSLAEAGLALDWREAMRAPSPRGQAIVPGRPEQSLLIAVLRHEISGAEMPKEKPRLPEETIADFVAWIEQGAYDPRSRPPQELQQQADEAWQQTFSERRQWWSLQPPIKPHLPTGEEFLAKHPVDYYVEQKQVELGLTPAPLADRRTLIRRLSFALTGLPPTVAEIERFLQDESSEAYETLVDRLLASPRFGERWARHWMDLVRYADSHGSEGDPAIPNVYQYRDYLIRAFNADVPYDQLVREHVAGDLLDQPRINEELGINDSAIGPAHLRLVFHGFAPTDALEEKVRFTDDQINVLSKAFLGLTVSCARCHDHKFDAISQRDYYALFGILASCRPAQRDVNTVGRQQLHRQRLLAIKQALRGEIATAWLASTDKLAEKLRTAGQADVPQDGDQTENPPQKDGILSAWRALQKSVAQHGGDFATTWQAQSSPWTEAENAFLQPGENAWNWNLASLVDFEDWFAFGNGLQDQPSAAGEFTVAIEGNQVLGEIYPAGAFSHLVSTKHRGFLSSPKIHLDDDYDVWLLVRGGGQATVRYAVQNYPRNGTVYPVPEIRSDGWYWQHFNLDYWNGDDIHLELATAKDAPLEVRDRDRSYFGVRQVVIRKKGAAGPPKLINEALVPIVRAVDGHDVASLHALSESVVEAARLSIRAWQDGELNDNQALFLNALLQDRLLSNHRDELPNVESLLDEYRNLEAEIPLPTRVPGVIEADAFDQPLYARGNHHQPLDPVPRRFLSAIDPTPFRTEHSGRLELAESLTSPDNPLVARVMVNRIWHYLFGRGLVATPDNFGRLGAEPTHGELLDFLAVEFVENDWSVKDMIRRIVLSRTWRGDSAATPEVKNIDPQNQWLAHANVRRLDAEAIRDALLSVAGELDTEMYGRSVKANSPSRRRSIYVASRRNSLDNFLQTFDAPVPFATTGRRSVTNVPAQSLTMLNEPFVLELARQWARRDLATYPDRSTEQRISSMFEQALGREPNSVEHNALKEYVQVLSSRGSPGEMTPPEEVWSRVAHAIFNLKEFIYVR